MPARIVVNADDFGASGAITRSILRCIEAGSVTSTTILANMPGTDDALSEARSRGRTSSFGVHLNLCEGRALTGPSSLTDAAGRFHPKRRQALRALSRRLRESDVEAELRAQMERVLDAGVQVSHVDGHKHLHQLPGVARVVARLAAEAGLSRVRCTADEALAVRGRPLPAVASSLARRWMARRAAPRFDSAGLRWPERTFDVRTLLALPDGDGRVRYLEALEPRGVVEMFCHPGLYGEGPEDEEERFFTDRERGFPRLMASAGLRPVTYWEV